MRNAAQLSDHSPVAVGLRQSPELGRIASGVSLRSILLATAMLLLFAGPVAVAARKSTFPDPDPPQYDLTKTRDFERRGDYLLGPTGARGWMHLRHLMTANARQILITEVSEGSPADGILQPGDVILGVNGQAFDADARRQLGAAINAAEANDGRLTLTRWRPATAVSEQVVIQLPRLGPEAASAPYGCDKSAKLYDQAVAALASDDNMGKLKALALLATGDPAQVARVKDYLHKQRWAAPDYEIDVDRGGKMTWSCGFGLLVMCEYYLLTGDDYVLPAIRENAIKASMGQSGSGTWGHGFALPRNNNGELHGDLAGYGALNLASLHLLNGLLLAKRCGIDHPELDQAIDRALIFFRQFTGHGSISYGQHRPSFEHHAAGKNALGANGKNGLAAIAFALAGDHHSARFFAKLCAAGHGNYEYGHGGNSFAVFWRSLGAAVGGPEAVAAFRRELQWYHTLTRLPDGSFATQPLGGFYGGETLNATTAHVLALSLPRRTLVITGRDDLARVPLPPTDTAAAVAAGQWRNANYDQLDSQTLLAKLGSFSPSAREWLAKALATRTDFPIASLIDMLAAADPNRRAGALAALGYQGQRAADAIPAITARLQDPASPVQVAAAYALARLGSDNHEVLAAMLRAAVATTEDEPIQPVTQALAYAIGYQQSYTAPLYFDGLLATVAATRDPLANLDRDLLYAAVRKFAANNNGRVRSTGVAALKYYDRTDVARNAQLIVDLIADSPRGHVMFRDAARAVAIDALAKHQIADGVDYAIDRLDFGYWGAVMRFPHRFETLAAYADHAHRRLPEIKQLRWRVPNGYNRGKLEAAITAIDKADPTANESLFELVSSQLAADLQPFDGTRQCANACRKWLEDYADDGFWQAAILRQLADLDRLRTGDLITAFNHRNPLTRQVAVELAAAEVGWFGKRRLLARLATAAPREQACIIALLPAWRQSDRATPYLISPQDQVRAAALSVVGAGAATTDLIAHLADPNFPETAGVAAELLQRRPDEFDAIQQAFTDADPELKLQLLRITDALPPSRTQSFLLSALADRDVVDAAAAILAQRPAPLLDDYLLAQLAAGKANRELQLLLLQRLVAETLAPAKRPAAWQALLTSSDVKTVERTLGEVAWLLPPAEAANALVPFLEQSDDRHRRGLPKRAAAAIRELADRCDPAKHPAVTKALKAAADHD